MMSPEGRTLSKPKLLLVEGKDDKAFFSSMVKRLDLSTSIEVREFRGTGNLPAAMKALTKDPGRALLKALGVIRDADNDADRTFQSTCTALQNAGLPKPQRQRTHAGNNPQVTVMILPVGKKSGMLEDVCLKSVEDDAAMKCVDRYFQCLAKCLNELPGNLAKAKVRTFLVSRELLEESHFEFLQTNLESWIPVMPVAPSPEKVHAFLASKFRPTLNLGTSASARRGGESYWPFDHNAFDEIKDFLQQL
jgi:Protein of unknown function (DUF3226)